MYELKSSLNEQDTQDYETIFNKALFKDYLVRARVKAEMYQDENRVKNTMMSCFPIDYNYDNNQLLEHIAKYQ